MRLFFALSLGAGTKESPASNLFDAQTQFRVIIAGDADASLESVATKINEGFEAGHVTKFDIANYVFLNLVRLLPESELKSIRTLHFDDKKMLGSLLKSEEELPEELKAAIRTHFGIHERERRRPLRT